MKNSKKMAFTSCFSMTARLARTAVTAGAIMTLAGCAGSILSGAGPYQRTIEGSANDENAPYTLIPITPLTIATYSRPPESELTDAVSQTAMPSIKLVPGDVMRLVISDSAQGGLFAPLAAGGTIFERVRVESDGHISLPYVKQLNVRGLTLSQAETAIRKRLRGVATDPQVHAELVGDLSGSVLVAGAVKAPGRFSTLQGPLTLLDAITQAGGPTLEPHLINVVVRTGKSVRQIGYEQLLNGKNGPIPPNSEIVLERARKRFVAMGAVNSPGLHDLPSNNPSLLEVLGSIGGLRENAADPTGVFVFRLAAPKDTKQEPVAEVFQLDMRDPVSIFLARKFLMQPEDAVFVTNSAVYEAQKIVSPIVQVMLLGRTVDRGF